MREYEVMTINTNNQHEQGVTSGQSIEVNWLDKFYTHSKSNYIIM